MKKWIWGISIAAVIVVVGAFFIGRNTAYNPNSVGLPKPEVAEGERGELGVDKNVNESTIDNYLGRDDSVYIDLRMLDDPGNYEAIGGDSKLSGYVNGFEVVPFPYIVNVDDLPSEVGNTYTGDTLFTKENDEYTPNYKESMTVIEDLFPRDKIIFLMCGGGGYSGKMKEMLVSLGWEEDKIYDVGGYWYYDGNNNVEVKRTFVDGSDVYDFHKVPYHLIDFNIMNRL